MADEPVLIMKRRFLGRILESGLLIIAVALGVGAAASGLSLFFHTNEYSNNLLISPEYREVVVTTKTNIDDMEEPVIEKSSEEGIKLSTYDLKAGELIPTISWSYVTNKRRIGFMTEEVLNEKNAPGRPGPGDEGEEDYSDFYDMVEDFKNAKDNPDYILPEIDRLTGLEVSSQFFDAWNLDALYGSLFTDQDYESKNQYLILGMGVAELLAGDDLEVSELINRKIISWESAYTVIGILQSTGTDYDDLYFAPIREISSNNKFRQGPGGNDQQLRFAVMNPEDLDSTAVMLQEWFDTTYKDGQVVVSNPRVEAERIVSRNKGISFLIMFLSLAGLFIASVNVSNILMSRSIRMKKHVGILKALGASKKSIIKLFVIEALAITGIGSILGTGLAIPLSVAMQKSLGLGEVSWLYIGIGVILSSILTLVFSVIPARQNSGIEAADAMRSAG